MDSLLPRGFCRYSGQHAHDAGQFRVRLVLTTRPVYTSIPHYTRFVALVDFVGIVGSMLMAQVSLD
jgi:hypothetical protein